MKGCAEFIFETKAPVMICQALAPEMDDDLHRSNIEMVLRDCSLDLTIRGDDVVSLRAALNTWIRLVKIAFEMVNI
jgi:KEOPS complex subunit Pcc1